MKRLRIKGQRDPSIASSIRSDPTRRISSIAASSSASGGPAAASGVTRSQDGRSSNNGGSSVSSPRDRMESTLELSDAELQRRLELRHSDNATKPGRLAPLSTSSDGKSSDTKTSKRTVREEEEVSCYHGNCSAASSPSPTAAPPSRCSTQTSRPKKSQHSGGEAASPAPGTSAVKFASELDNAAVEAYLEYLTRPHTSWESASRYAAQRKDALRHREPSVFTRSLASTSRSSSFASAADLMELSLHSVASAPAGFPRSASNKSKTQVGMLRKGRLMDGSATMTEVAAPPSRASSVTRSSRCFSLPKAARRPIAAGTSSRGLNDLHIGGVPLQAAGSVSPTASIATSTSRGQLQRSKPSSTTVDVKRSSGRDAFAMR